MKVETQIEIQGTKQAIWSVITNIANATEHIIGIDKIDILEQPAEGLIGLKWKEERTMFGKTATEIMWIVEAVENDHYVTRAESHGFIYHCALRITDHGDGCLLAMSHSSEAQTLVGKIIGPPMGLIFKGMMKKALQKDLVDIKATVEGTAA